MSEISHKGIVKAVEGGIIRVGIISEAACKSCAAAGLCTAAEAKEKIITVRAEGYTVGEEVELSLSEKVGLRAALLCYGVPVLLLVIVALSLSIGGVGELLCAGAAVAVVAVYYLALYLLRNRISRTCFFSVRKANTNNIL